MSEINYTLNTEAKPEYTIDIGTVGTRGKGATVNVGTTTTLHSGVSASVDNSGTSSDGIFNFSIPKGSVWFHGSGIPTSIIGDEGDYYIDTDTNNIYNKTSNIDWTAIGYIAGGGVWGAINGTLSNQVDLQNILDTKYDNTNFIAGTNYLIPAGNGSLLTNLNGSEVASGTIADARLTSNVTLQGNTFNGASQLVQLDSTGSLSQGVLSSSGISHKNMIINGDMVIDQRNCGASITPTTDAKYSLDRWCMSISQASKYSVQQVSDAPANFNNSLKVTSLSAYSLVSSDFFGVFQNIEGYNIAKLGFGSSSAKPITLSFWVKSSLTGIFVGRIANGAGNRSYPFSYAVNTANTWEKKTITIPGDTTGTWLTTNGTGFNVYFGLGLGANFVGSANSWQAGNFSTVSGAVSLVGTSGATWQLTGVQLEQGSVATDYEYRPYGTELALCQRYFSKSYDINVIPATFATNGPIVALAFNTYDFYTCGYTKLPVSMRTAPTVNTYSTVTGASGKFWNVTAQTDIPSSVTEIGNNSFHAYGNNTLVSAHQYSYHWTADAEL